MKRALILLAFLGSFSTMSSAQTPSQVITITHSGDLPASIGAVANFTGTVKVDARFQRESPARIGGGIVSFEPSARTAWHSHPLGQTLIVSAGTGRVQQWGCAIQEIKTGDFVWIPPGVKHWHGASPTQGMTHIAIAEALDGNSSTWMEKVTDEQYETSTP